MADKRKKQKERGINRSNLKKLILQIFTNYPDSGLNYKQLAKKLGISDYDSRMAIPDVLAEMEVEGLLALENRGKYKFKASPGTYIGTVDLTSKGAAYVEAEGLDEDIFISQRNLSHALHGDQVKVQLFARKRSRGPEGEVVEILKRGRTTFVGSVEVGQSYAFLTTDTKNMPYDIFIPFAHLNGAKDGQKAIAKIVEWPENARNPVGEIVEILGDPGVNDVEMHAILAEFELPHKFPKEVDEAAGKIKPGITKKEIASRRDFRDILTFTIDPFDAKDFDDALSLRRLNNGFWEVGVHIADVTHYVRPGSIIEEEAYSRATSVYLVDRVVPMLPEHLSNFICSLRPEEEKLTYSAVFELDEEGVTHNQWFGRTVIRSDKRFTYEEAQEIIEKGEGTFAQELLTLDRIAKKLRQRRVAKGAISFEKVEIKFDLDENSKPLNVFFKQIADSNHLIEEFMLLANRKVAAFLGKPADGTKGPVSVYRIHDLPDSDKLKAFSDFIKRFGHSIALGAPAAISKSINALMDKVKGKPESDVIGDLAIRSMAKAKYSTKNIGHYGLAFDYYTHFTSPIRRYPDMMVHRLLTHYMAGGKSVHQNEWEDYCRHSSEMEQKAANAERASIKYKQVEFMKDRLGQVYLGLVSGVTQWGLYIEIIENKIEGMVPIRELDDDFYEYNEKAFCIVGRHTKKKYQLGDRIHVQIAKANIARRQIDMVIVDEKQARTRPKKRG